MVRMIVGTITVLPCLYRAKSCPGAGLKGSKIVLATRASNLSCHSAVEILLYITAALNRGGGWSGFVGRNSSTDVCGANPDHVLAWY